MSTSLNGTRSVPPPPDVAAPPGGLLALALCLRWLQELDAV